MTENAPAPLKIAPSILSADFARMGDAVARLAGYGADWGHFDVMDGHFAPNLTFGPMMCAAVRPLTHLPLDVHLMVERPGDYVEPFHAAGADCITFHVEADAHVHRTLQSIRARGMRAGVVLNPATPVCMAEPVLPLCDLVLLMSVNPGFGGQAFIPEVLDKIRALRALIDARGLPTEIEVDGGINPDTARLCAAAGATVRVAGSRGVRAVDPAALSAALRGA